MKDYKTGVTNKDVMAHQKENMRIRVHSAADSAIKAKMGGIKLEKGRGREGSMQHKATGLKNTRALFD